MFHVHEKPLPSGSIVQPGRWGATVLAHGEKHKFWFREHLLEMWRREKAAAAVSRFTCSYAYELQEQAVAFTKDIPGFVHRVVPVDANAKKTRADMLWLTWMGEPGKKTESIMGWCAAYWSGKAAADIKPGAVTTWEWLIDGALEITGGV